MNTAQKRIVFFGGVYSNYLALEALFEDLNERGWQSVYCLGDLGAFGPFPDRSCEMLRIARIPCIQGNYDNSVGNGLANCQCGYTDPRDNYFARLSYDYTFRRTSNENKTWLKSLPTFARIQIGPYRALLCHGSPRKTNEFLWESTTSDAFLNWLFEKYETDIIVATHTGLHWHREPSPGKHFINCGAIGRPPNDGETTVVYSVVSIGGPDTPDEKCLNVEFIRLAYDHARLARDMDLERLPDEFIATIRTGWWTTCNEILPAKERARGIY